MAKVPNGKETLPKISTGCVGRTNVTDRQTDRRTDDDIIKRNDWHSDAIDTKSKQC